ncbi:uncharacterized protein B0H64DRAFT_391813 [Chaetomium fimeti]|uniref:NACHT domain-containing protein n=1 Tax=Chaetomium fimeti TaxID=1854472 RepID=A0AAE0LU06_9PEZI|nr:hypothetical protein B0H64DRAFT_391813 [Chaetomium fimeti]
MAEPTDSSLWVEEAFLSAKNEFLKSLANKSGFDFSKVASAEDVLDAARVIEQQQKQTKTQRGLARIKPLITVLQEYSGVIDTFAQVKPDVLCLIWGPLKFILQTASTVTVAFENIVKTLGEIRLILPSFKTYRDTFPRNDVIRQVLLLFFEDILGLYSVLLNFATNSRLRMICEPFWPGVRAKVDKIREHMQSHKALMTEAVTLEDIVRAQTARNLALAEYDHAQKFRDYQEFRAVRDEVNPETRYEKLDDILRKTTKGSGTWLDQEKAFMNWLNPVDRTVRCFWLCGIPGAGKTFLAGNIIQRLQRTGQCVLFAFLTHEQQSSGKTLGVLHSLLFQALEQVPSLQVLLPDHSSPDRRKLLRDRDFVKETLCTVVTSIGPAYIVLDGLDEIEESCWRDLLVTVFGIKERCTETKVLISSREEREITLALKDRATALHINKYNHEDIRAFVRCEMEGLLLRFGDADEQVRSRIRAALELIPDKSDGMFLYAQLVLHVVKDYGTAEEIQAEVDNLPDGLYKAYGRLISRIEQKNVPNKLRSVIRRVLMWIACATRPLREEELLQVLVIDIGENDFTRGRKEYRDVRRDCGPIIEVLDGAVRFVHFSAKEYLLHEQSNSFLSLADAHLDAALTCATYLCFTSFDSLLSADWEATDIQCQIRSGDFVLLEYAALEYMDHIKGWMANKTDEGSVEQISTTLNQLFEIRQNHFFNSSAPPASFISEFKTFQADQDLQHRLASASSFLTGVKIGVVDMDEATGTSNNNPLGILPALVEFRRHLEHAVCDGPNHSPGCACPTLKRLYGPRLYHCRKAFCSAYTNGFETNVSLIEHLKIHAVNHRCHFPNCVFADIGFRTSEELSRHIGNAHETRAIPDFSRIGAVQAAALPERDQQELLCDAVANGQFDAVRNLASPSVLAGCSTLLIGIAGWNAPPDLLSWLLDHECCKSSPPAETNHINIALHAAIEGENLPNVKLLLSHGADITSRCVVRIHSNDSWYRGSLPGILRALKRWNGALMKFLVDECGVMIPQTWDRYHVSNVDSDPGIIFEANHLADATLENARRRFSAIKPFILWPEAYALGPYFATQARSPALVRISLENGGDPNRRESSSSRFPLYACITQRGEPHREIMEVLLEYKANPNALNNGGTDVWETALQSLSTITSSNILDCAELLLRHGADPNRGDRTNPIYNAVRRGRSELVKLLLQHGASPSGTGTKQIESLAGMKKVEKYFEMPWDDIVRRIQAGEDVEGKRKRVRA